jgi:hypothetical protein
MLIQLPNATLQLTDRQGKARRAHVFPVFTRSLDGSNLRFHPGRVMPTPTGT